MKWLKDNHQASLAFYLLLWSIISIFSELAFVRLFTVTVGSTCYYGNLFLLIGIFSLACGFFAQKLFKYVVMVPYGILTGFLFALWFGKYNLIPQISSELIWSATANAYPKPSDFDLKLVIVVLALLIIPVMMVIGSQQAHFLFQFEKGFVAYLIISFGGMIGAVLFFLQNQFFPQLKWLIFVWILLLVIPLYSALKRRPAKVFGIFPLLILLILGWHKSDLHLWSPYQRIDQVSVNQKAVDILSNGFFITRISLSPVKLISENERDVQAWVFKTIKKNTDVLILGSGGGTSDVREALFAGAKSVTAVEIEPVFVKLGLQMDPDRSYLNPRVRLVVGDARKFIAQDNKKYDYIYIPFLDSQTNASNHSRFRLDSFLYTRECMELALAHLKKGGVLYINFVTVTDWIRYKIYLMLKTTTKRSIRVFDQAGIRSLYVVTENPGIFPILLEKYVDITDKYQKQAVALSIPTDDWPFLYSLDHSVPREHAKLLLYFLLMMIVVLSISHFLQNKIDFLQPAIPYSQKLCYLGYAFFSGAAFFFIELRTISALTPIIGSSYKSQAAVIIAIIVISFLGALLASYNKKISLIAIWGVLFLSLILCQRAFLFFHPFKGNILPSTIVYVIVLIFPTFMAGYLYLRYLLKLPAASVMQMQKWNLLGGAIGGLGEVIVIITGYQNSIIFAIVLYFLAFLCALFISKRLTD